MSGNNTVISVRHLKKSYRHYKNNMQKIRFLLLMQDAGSSREILKDVSFTIKKGEKVGIIGRQQSGKSTLMRILGGVIRPDSGKVKIEGSVSPILNLRLGFDAAMTGRDNYTVMGTALGWSSAMLKEHEDAVFEFARLSKKKDDPVKTYNKGVAGRLGFAIATEIRNDIVLYDANLSFGGKGWNKACTNRLKNLIAGDTTFVMAVNKIPDGEMLCERGIVIHKGRVVFDGPYADAAAYFYENCRQNSRKKSDDTLEDTSDDQADESIAEEEINSDDDDDV